MSTKRCARCREEKAVGEFYAHPHTRDGLGSWCKPCCKQRELERSSPRREAFAAKKRTAEELAARGARACSRCGKEKPVTSFYRAGTRGRCGICMECMNTDRVAKLAEKYGISECEFWGMWFVQSGRCPLCGVEMRPIGTDANSATIDHCHDSGRIRGLLCGACNKQLGGYERCLRIKAKVESWLARGRQYGLPHV